MSEADKPLQYYQDELERKRAELRVEQEAFNHLLEDQLIRNQIQSDLYRLLAMSLESDPLETTIRKMLDALIHLPWLSLGPDWVLVFTLPETGEYVGEYRATSCDVSLDIVPWRETLSGGISAWAQAAAVWHLIPLREREKPALGILILKQGPHQRLDETMLEFLAGFSNLLVGAIQRKLAEETLWNERWRYYRILNESPVPIFEADISGMRRWLAALDREPRQNTRAYLQTHPEEEKAFWKGIRLCFANPEAIRILGAESAETVIKGWLRTAENNALLRDVFLRAAEGQGSFQTEISFRSFQGQPVCGVIRACLSAENMLLLTLMDITDRKRIEESLRESEEKFRCVLNNLGAGVALIDSDFHIVLTNRQMQAWFPDNAADRPFQCFMPGCDACAVRKTLSDGGMHQSELRRMAPAGEEFYHIKAFPWRDPDKGSVGAVELIEDMSARVRAEQSLQQALERIELLFSAMPLILISVNREDQVMQWNVFAEQLLGLTQNEVLGRPFSELPISWEWRPVLRNLPRISIRNGQPIYLKSLRFTRLSGQDGFLNLIVTAIPSEGNYASEILLVGTDVTEQKKMEIQLLQAQKLEAIGQLAAGIAHEINTPIQFVGDNLLFIRDAVQAIATGLNAGRGIIRAAASGIDPQRLQEWEEQEKALDLDYVLNELPKALADSQNGIVRVANLVRAMKGFAHRESSGATAPTDINQALENTVTVSRNEWKYAAEVTLNLDPELPLVECYADEMNQVFLNILVNAAHAVEAKLGKNPTAKGQIAISTAVQGPLAEIRFQDSGAGIPESIQNRIFEPFFTTKPVGKGTGQGLAIARSVVEKHGGKIEFESRPGQGTTFMIRIPIRAAKSNPV